MPQVMTISNSMIQGIRRELEATWKNVYPTFEKEWNLMFYKLPDNGIRTAQYAFKEALPMPQYWPYNEEKPQKSILDRLLSVSVFPYAMDMEVNMFDREDDQIGDTKTHMNMIVERYLTLYSHFFSEYLNATANFLPSLETAFDGAGLFSATNGAGADRFGVSGGNIITGSGTTIDAIANDIFEANERFQSFLDNESQIIFDASMVDYTKMHVFYPKELNKQFFDLTKGDNLRTDLASNTAVSNTLKGTFQSHCINLLTDSADYFIMLEHSFWKPLLLRQENAVQAFDYNMQNSDRARKFGVEGLSTHMRTGAGVWAPWVIIKVNNS